MAKQERRKDTLSLGAVEPIFISSNFAKPTTSPTVKNSSPKNPKISPWQQTLNATLANFWVGPLVVMYWCSSWNLVAQELIFPNDSYTSIWVSAGIGFGILFISSLAQKLVPRLCIPEKKQNPPRTNNTNNNDNDNSNNNICSALVGILVSRLYIYVMGFGSVNQWRSIWHAWDIYTSGSIYNALGTALGAYGVMLLMRCSSQALAPPSLVALDVPSRSCFEVSTYFRTEAGTWRHVLDSLFTVTVVHISVVTAWRGVWHLSDRCLVPDDPVLSAVVSLAIAYGLEAMLLMSRAKWKRVSEWSDSQHVVVKCVLEDIHSFLHALVSISHWRGFWILYDQNFMQSPLKLWLGHCISYALLTLSVCSHSIVVKGCLRDGMETKGKGVDLDMYYVTKLHRMLSKTKARTATPEDHEPNCWQSLHPVEGKEHIKT